MSSLEISTITLARINIGEFRLDFRTDSDVVYLSRGDGEAMQTTLEKLTPTLRAALQKFWEQEY